MKIAHIINSLNIGGAEKLIIDIVPLFQKKRLEVDVITLDTKETGFTEELQKTSNGKLIQLPTTPRFRTRGSWFSVSNARIRHQSMVQRF